MKFKLNLKASIYERMSEGGNGLLVGEFNASWPQSYSDKEFAERELRLMKERIKGSFPDSLVLNFDTCNVEEI